MKTIKNICTIILLGFYLSCSEKENNNNSMTSTPKEDGPNTFGWSEKKKDDLLNQCMERYKAKATETSIVDKKDYCDCLIEKISTSILFDDYTSSSFNTSKQIDNYSKVCETLTTVSQ